MKMVKGAAKVLLVCFIALAIIGVLYEKLGERRDRRRFPQIGRSIDVGGRSLNLYCSGSGSPTVVFEGAGHTAGFAWIHAQQDTARFTRSCWYDRAGYGWSDPGPSPRTFKAIAQDLHALVNAAGEQGPYVLVGATAGAFHVRVFNALFPRDVAGAVLIHASDTDIFQHEPEYMKGGFGGDSPILQKLGCHVLAPAMLRVGLLRLMNNPGAGRPYGMANLAPSEQKELLFLSNNPSTVQTEGEGCVLDESMAEVRGAGTFGDRPLIVITGAQPFRSPAARYAKATESLNDFWFRQMQPRLAALSTHGQLIVADDAEKTDAIVAAVGAVVQQVRLNAPAQSLPDRP